MLRQLLEISYPNYSAILLTITRMASFHLVVFLGLTELLLLPAFGPQRP